MNNEKIAEFLQEPLQEAFDAECRSYEICLKTYESMLETWEKLEVQEDELKEKQELDEKVSSYKQTFNSSEFDKIRKLVNLSDSVARNFISAFSLYEGMSDLTEKINDIEYAQDTISRLYNAFRERLRAIQTSVNGILYNVSEKKVKLEFPEKKSYSRKMFNYLL